VPQRDAACALRLSRAACLGELALSVVWRTWCSKPSSPPNLPAVALASTSTSTAAAAAAAATTTALGALFVFVDAKRTPVERGVVHLGDRLGGLLSVAHGHEAEAARLSGLTIGDEVDVGHRAERRESGAKRVGGRLKRKVTHVESVAHAVLFSLKSSPRKRTGCAAQCTRPMSR